MNQEIGTGLTAREEFGARQLARVPETAVSAAAAQAQAAVQARYIVALQRPRSADMVRAKLLKECDRPAFAHVAEYRLPRGGKTIVGPSIRFAEAALRALGNVLPEQTTVYDDPDKRIVRVAVTDLETNLTYSRDVTISKTMERKSPRKGQAVLAERENSMGEIVCLVEITEDELLLRESALVSKALRTLALRLIPGDLVDEALARCAQTIAAGDKADPEAARRRLLDAFGQIGVSPADLSAWLGHDTATINPAEITDLRGLYSALKEGATTWADIMDERAEAKASKAEGEKAQAATGTNGHAAVVKRIAELRLQNPTAYKAACERAAIPTAQDWSKVPEDIASGFLADLTKECTK